MTNLLAAIVVAVVTNTTEVLPTKMIPAPCPDANQTSFIGGVYAACLVMHYQSVPDPDAKEKTIQTVCKEVTTLRFDWNGPREVVSERILWQSNVVLRLDWRPAK